MSPRFFRARYSVVATWDTPPPTTVTPRPFTAFSKPLAAVRGPTRSLKEKVSSDHTVIPSRAMMARSMLLRSAEVLS